MTGPVERVVVTSWVKFKTVFINQADEPAAACWKAGRLYGNDVELPIISLWFFSSNGKLCLSLSKFYADPMLSGPLWRHLIFTYEYVLLDHVLMELLSLRLHGEVIIIILTKIIIAILLLLLGAIHKLSHTNLIIFWTLSRPCHRWSHFWDHPYLMWRHIFCNFTPTDY